MTKHLDLIIKIAVVIGIISGGMAYFAKAEDLQMVKLRLDQKIVSDQLYDTQRQAWDLEERNRGYGSDPMAWPDKRDRTRYKVLLDQLDKLKAREKNLMK